MILRATLVCAAKALRPPNIVGNLNEEWMQMRLKRIDLDPKQADEIRACGEALTRGQQFTYLAFAATTAWATFLAMERGVCSDDETRPSFCVQKPEIKLYPPWPGSMSDAERRGRITDATGGMDDQDRILIIVEPEFVLSFLASLIPSPDDLARAVQRDSFDITIEETVIQYIPQT